MATKKELINAVRTSLEADGELGRLKAEMRAGVMRLLDCTSKTDRDTKIECPRNVALINELIREYLDWIGYKYTSSVLAAECNLPSKPLDRSYLLQDLGLRDSEKTKSVPLLCNLVEMTKMAE